MNTKKGIKELSKGQILPLFALAIFVLIAMAALILDGSMIMSHRRTAQAAADAGALSGAEYLCPNVPPDQVAAAAEATLYVGNNGAEVELISFPDTSTIHVEARVETDSFFAKIFGQTDLAANAVAEASCTPLSTGSSTLPIVFPCEHPLPDDPDYGIVDCRKRYYDEDLTYQQNIEARNFTIIHDTESLILNCYDPVDNPTGVDCDGVVSLGSRGWVSLDGSVNKNNMESWIDGSLLAPEIFPGFWLSSFQGDTTSMFIWIKNWVAAHPDDTYIVPIYGAHCEFSPPSTYCTDAFVFGNDNDEYCRDATGQDSYRIVGFGLFKITCVSDKNNSGCDYRDYLVTQGVEFNKFAGNNSVKTIEGYFIEGTIEHGGGEGVDHGVYVVNLIR
jgi:hypothetical protein